MMVMNESHETSSPTRGASISAGVVRALAEAVEAAGVSRDAFLSAVSCDGSELGGVEARVSGAKVYRLCELAMVVTDDPAFGLHFAERLSLSALVPVSHLIAHSATLRHALDSLARFQRLVSDHGCHEIVEQGDKVMMRCVALRGSPAMQRFAAEQLTVFFLRVLRSFDRQVVLEGVSFAYPAPAYSAEYERVFEGRARFDQPYTGLSFDRALLDRPAPHKDDDLHEALSSLAERRLMRILNRTPYALRVREVVVRAGAAQRSDMLDVARALGMSARSLRRHLSSEGKSFTAVVNEALAFVAKQLLRREQRTIQETAHEMGFSDPRVFHRAFKRWTGMTPGAYQRDNVATR
jgi:AraC-like DNA-binding protein